MSSGEDFCLSSDSEYLPDEESTDKEEIIDGKIICNTLYLIYAGLFFLNNYYHIWTHSIDMVDRMIKKVPLLYYYYYLTTLISIFR
jgi:hypothetical protein